MRSSLLVNTHSSLYTQSNNRNNEHQISSEDPVAKDFCLVTLSRVQNSWRVYSCPEETWNPSRRKILILCLVSFLFTVAVNFSKPSIETVSWFFESYFLLTLIWKVMFEFDNVQINIGFLYNITFFPALLLIFYPMVFGIQRDEDARMLEILFGIPD